MDEDDSLCIVSRGKLDLKDSCTSTASQDSQTEDLLFLKRTVYYELAQSSQREPFYCKCSSFSLSQHVLVLCSNFSMRTASGSL